MAISKEIQKSSEMKFNGKLIQVTYDIADVNGKDAWREVVHHPGATAIVAVTGDNKIVMERQFRYALQQTLLRYQQENWIQMKNRLFVLNGSLLRKPAIVQLNGFR